MGDRLVDFGPACIWCGRATGEEPWTYILAHWHLRPLCETCCRQGDVVLLAAAALGVFLDWCVGGDNRVALRWPPDLRARIIVALGGAAPLNLLPPGGQGSLELRNGGTE